MKQAAINVNVMKARALEQRLKEIRSMNLPGITEMVDMIEKEMMKLCDNDLSKLDMQKLEEKIVTYNAKRLAEKMREPGDAIISAVTGFASTVALDTVEFIGGSAAGIGYLFIEKTFAQGYTDFNDRIVEPVREYIEEKVDINEYEVVLVKNDKLLQVVKSN